MMFNTIGKTVTSLGNVGSFNASGASLFLGVRALPTSEILQTHFHTTSEAQASARFLECLIDNVQRDEAIVKNSSIANLKQVSKLELKSFALKMRDNELVEMAKPICTTEITAMPLLTVPSVTAKNMDVLNTLNAHNYRDVEEAAKNGEFDPSVVTEFAKLANFTYSHDSLQLPDGWMVNMELSLQALSQLNSRYQLQNSGVITTKEGLTAAILQKGDQVVISMGGTGSGKNGGTMLTLALRNPANMLNQWYHNLNHGIYANYIPEHYQQAANLTAVVNTLAKGKVSTTGHSLGGGLSSFAAAMVGEPTKPMASYSYCSAQIGEAMREKIAEKCNSALEAEDLICKIKHFTVKGDPVSRMHEVRCAGNINLIGTIYEIDPKSQTHTWYDWINSMFTENGVMLHKNYEYYWTRLQERLSAECHF